MTSPNDVLQETRGYWLDMLTKIASPLLTALSRQRLKATMPVEFQPGHAERKAVTHLEAFGRLTTGIAPWLELGTDTTAEGKDRSAYADLVRRCLAIAVDPSSPDFMNFSEGGQPLVDAAFLAHGLLRGLTQLWQPLDSETKARVISALRLTRVIRPAYTNWLLFSAMIEIFFLETGSDWDQVRVDYAVRKHLEWYKGDGVYGDGPEFHWDYYNSFVIHPMLLEVLRVLAKHGLESRSVFDRELERARRFAAVQERLISPEGTFPPIGRSLAYRCGAFHLLAQMALMKELPQGLPPAQVRSALSAVIHRTMEAPGTFDAEGWLTVGLHGHQPSIGEAYISTGSLYLCSAALLPLGLPPEDPFWAAPPQPWTQRRAWGGAGLAADHAYEEAQP